MLFQGEKMIKRKPSKGDMVEYRLTARSPSEYGLVLSIDPPDRDYWTEPAELIVRVLGNDGEIRQVSYMLIDKVLDQSG
jgi:hypothetical protein